MLQLKPCADRVFNNLYFGRNNHIFLPLNRVIFLIEDTLLCFMDKFWPARFVQNQFIARMILTSLTRERIALNRYGQG